MEEKLSIGGALNVAQLLRALMAQHLQWRSILNYAIPNLHPLTSH